MTSITTSISQDLAEQDAFLLKNLPFSEVRKALRPVLRSKIATDNEHYEFDGDDLSQFEPTPRQPFSSDTNILLTYDGDGTFVQVGKSMLDSWGVSFSEALDIALKNLAVMSRRRFKKIKPGLFSSDCNTYFNDDSGLLLFKSSFDHCQLHDPVIMIPTSGPIFIASKANRHAQLSMLYLARKEIKASKEIVSTQMYHFVDGKPTEYEPEDRMVLFELNAIRKPQLQQYADQQKKIVEDFLARTGNWARIHPLLFSQTKYGQTESTSIWSADTECIFPEADTITVSKARESEDGGYAVENDPVFPWNRVIKRYGHLLQKLDGFPSLYFATPFPDYDAIMTGAA